MSCPVCGSDLYDGTSPCPQCGYREIPSSKAVSSSPEQNEPVRKDPPQGEDALNGYLSYTSADAAKEEPAKPDAGPYVSSESRSSGSGNSGKEWIPYAAVICGALSAYSAPMIVPGVLLGITAVILGILGCSAPKKSLAVIGIVTGVIGIILSVLFALFYFGIFKLIYDYLMGGFGFRMFSGW